MTDRLKPISRTSGPLPGRPADLFPIRSETPPGA
jgi:hypothetical protein